MSRIPKDPEAILPVIVDDYRRVYGDNLVSIILYGSAARGDYTPGRSDINLMIVLSDNGMDGLDNAFDVIAKWKKRNVATPLFVTEDYVRTSTDVFPLEYFNFQKNYRMVYGKDILRELTFAPAFIRLQCEREIKGKLLVLRQAFLETGGKARNLRKVVTESLVAFVAIFHGLLYLKGRQVPDRKRDVVEYTCEAFDLDRAVFDSLLDIQEDRSKPSGQDMRALFMNYLRQIRRLWKRVDELDKDVTDSAC